MHGTAGDLYIFGVKAGAFDGWQLYATMGALTLQARGDFASVWVSAGAKTARVRAVAVDRDRRPIDPQPPYPFWCEGTISELTRTTVRLINVKTIEGDHG